MIIILGVGTCSFLSTLKAGCKCINARVGEQVEPELRHGAPDLVHELGGGGHPVQGPGLAELETKVIIIDMLLYCLLLINWSEPGFAKKNFLSELFQ